MLHFIDRTHAGRVLAHRLVPLLEGPVIVAGIPRGGVVTAAPVAERLGAPLVVVHARKLTLPAWPELAFGAMDEDGFTVEDPETVEALEITPEQREGARLRVGQEIERLKAAGLEPSLSGLAGGFTVVLVDDGLATGLTMRAAIRYARRHGAGRVIVAAPCAARDAVLELRREADLVLGLLVPEPFVAVGRCYQDFPTVTERQVRELLQAYRHSAPASAVVTGAS